MKTGYIKIKKVWKKEFSNEEIDLLWQVFNKVTQNIYNVENIDWTKNHYKSYVKAENAKVLPIHPESDIRDNTEGISPKQIKMILSYLPIEFLEVFLTIVSKSVLSFNTSYWDYECKCFSWKDLIKNEFISNLTENEESNKIFLSKFIFLNLIQGKNSISGKKVDNSKKYFYENYSEEIYLNFLNGELDLDTFLEFDKLENLPKNTNLQSKHIMSIEDYYKSLEEDWLSTHGFKPKNKEVLALDPEFWFKKEYLESMNYLFGEKQLSKLDSSSQKEFLNLYRIFGIHLPLVSSIIKNSHYKSSFSEISLYRKFSKQEPGFIKILEQLKRGIDIQIKVEDLICILSTFTLPKTDDIISNKERVSFKDLNALKETGGLLTKYQTIDSKILEYLSFRELGLFKKYNISERDSLEVLKVYKDTRDIKIEDIPLLKGSVGGYEWEMLPKNDMRWLIAGRATNCCQHVSGAAKTCIYNGSKMKNVSLFLISKDDKIIAQSFVWFVKGQLTFDSIEFLGGNNSKEVAKCYLDYSKEAYKSKSIKSITVGAKGRLGSDLTLPQAKDCYSAPSGLYTDARTQYTIEK